MSTKPDRRTNLQRIKELEEQVAALEVKLDAAVNHSSGQDDQLKVQHGKLGLLEVRVAKAEKRLVKPRVVADEAAAATPPPPPPGSSPSAYAQVIGLLEALAKVNR